jgi:hypothetical protein
MIEREASGRPKIGTEWNVEEARTFGGQADEKVCCKCTSVFLGTAELGSEYVYKGGCWPGLSIQSIHSSLPCIDIVLHNRSYAQS